MIGRIRVWGIVRGRGRGRGIGCQHIVVNSCGYTNKMKVLFADLGDILFT